MRIVNENDMRRAAELFDIEKPRQLPVSYKIGGVRYNGIPSRFPVRSEKRIIDANIYQTVYRADCGGGLELRCEITQYRDYPVVEWITYFENKGTENTPVISEFLAADITFRGREPRYIYSNGDTCTSDGYELFEKKLTAEPVVLSTPDGTSCNGAFPYMRVMFPDGGVNIAVGWSSRWRSEMSADGCGAHFTAGQEIFNTYIKPGEVMRSPRITAMAFEGDESVGRNMWRRWYFAHILLRENGAPLKPLMAMHVMGNGPEFTDATEDNQISGMETYISRGLKPDIWWLDAGWYPCNRVWQATGSWFVNKENFPHGLKPVGEFCEKNDIRFLLWFEPERVSQDTWLYRHHHDWLLTKPGRDSLLNYAIPQALDWATETIDAIIKESRVKIYRQDFNFAPDEIWRYNEESDRAGAVENLHIQGYYRLWDELIRRNPGLWIDSCASGGRRNDLETMRRAVPLHYTDVGYGVHPIKQKQHRLMFEWIPYFRAHTWSWDNEEGTYEPLGARPYDEFCYQAAMAPAVTFALPVSSSEEEYKTAVKMEKVWRRGAEIMLSGDYYPLTECRKSERDYYAMQFDRGERGDGFIQVLRNTLAPGDSFTLCARSLVPEGEYELTNGTTGEKFIYTGERLMSGIKVYMLRRCAALFFYNRIK